ncbi:MAG: phage scaffolding protein [Paraclostridium sp.]
MILELLKNNGVDTEKANEIVKAMNDAKIYTTTLENVDVRYNKLKDKVTQLEETNKNYEVQVKDLSKNNKDNTELQAQLEKLQLSNKELIEKHTKEMYDKDFNFALDKSLSDAKARNTKAVKALLDMNSIKYQEGTLNGLQEQLEALKGDASYLFEVEEVKGNGGFNPAGAGTQITKENFSSMSYFERVELKQNNPTLYNELIN